MARKNPIPKRNVRERIVSYLHYKDDLTEWTVEDLSKGIGLDKKTLGNCLFHMKRVGMVVNTGERGANGMAVWRWGDGWGPKLQEPKVEYEKPVAEQPKEGFSLIQLGQAVMEVVRSQDALIKENNDVISELIAERDDLRERLERLQVRLNELTNGRVTLTELRKFQRGGPPEKGSHVI